MTAITDPLMNGILATIRAGYEARSSGIADYAGRLFETYTRQARHRGHGQAEARAMAQEIAALIGEYRHRRPRDTGDGPTPEMAARPAYRDPLAAMTVDGEPRLLWEHVQAGREIARIYEAVTASVAARGRASMAAGRAHHHWDGGSTLPAHLDALYRDRYIPWCGDVVKARMRLAPLVDVIVFGRPIYRVAADARIDRKTLRRWLLKSLDLYGERKYAQNKAHRRTP